MTTKEFEKQTLEQLLIDLKDIDNYKSFRKGAFVYDLGHYQGQLLLQEIERLNNIIKEVREYCNDDNNFEILTDFDTFENHNRIGKDILEILDKGSDKE